MEFRQLLYAIEIAEHKSFSKAAHQLHIAQPSLSQQIAKLEAELGVTLFNRTHNPLEVTHAGTRFVEQAAKIIDMMDQLQIEMRDIKQMKRGKLVIGSLPI